MALTPKQRAFVAEFLVDHNATQAAIRAGYSPKTANRIASRLLSKVDVQEAIAAATSGVEGRTLVRADQVVRELALVGLSSIDHYRVDDAGRVRLAEDAPPHAIRAVSSMRRRATLRQRNVATANGVTTTVEVLDVTTEVRLWPKVEALGKLAKHLGLLPDRHEHSGPGGAPIRMSHENKDSLPPEQAVRAFLAGLLAGGIANRAGDPPLLANDGRQPGVDAAHAPPQASAVPPPR